MTKLYDLARYLEIQRRIPAPVRKVWPVFLDMNRWYVDYHWDWISGPLYEGVGLQEGQILKAAPLYGAALNDSTLFFYQEQLKVTKHSEIVVKLTPDNLKSMYADFGTEVHDIVAFYHWHFTEVQDSTLIAIRSFSNVRTDKRPAEKIITDIAAAFDHSWSKCFDKLEALVCPSAGT